MTEQLRKSLPEHSSGHLRMELVDLFDVECITQTCVAAPRRGRALLHSALVS